jgi:peptidoglycan/xylan/chitin deacetylase (PgdA/CDA1 family)
MRPNGLFHPVESALPGRSSPPHRSAEGTGERLMARNFAHGLVAIVLAGSGVLAAALSPPGVAGRTPSESAPMAVRFEAGTHVGYRFSTNGDILATRTATLARASTAHSVRRTSIHGHGMHLLITDGIWAGYYVRESIASFIKGVAAERDFAPATTLSFPVGTVMGYTYDAGWQMTSATSIRLDHPSHASSDRFAVINGIRSYHIVNGGLAGRWVSAGAAGTTLPLACRTGSRAVGGSEVYRQVSGAGREVALTFDLGGRTEPALVIVKRLLRYGVCTTVFPTGDAALTEAGSRVLRFIGRYPQIFEVGNHTQDHCDLVNGGGDTGCPATRQPASFVQSQLAAAAANIETVTGQDPQPYWRPPYGSHDPAVRSAAASVGYSKTVMWHVDTIDWRPPPPTDVGPTTVQIIDKVVGGTGNGSIVLMHLGGWNTYSALPGIVDGLRTRSIAPTTVSDLVDGR